MSVDVTFVVPARNEEGYVGETLDSIADAMEQTDAACEVIVADGDSDDETVKVAREHGARVVQEGGESIANGRNVGAETANGDWLAFVDADTRVESGYVDEMLGYVRKNNLVAASSLCRVTGWRGKPMQATVNRVFPRLDTPVLPGFNTFVRRDAFEACGGYPDVPNEDTAFSSVVGREGGTGYADEVLVETSGRRFAESGLSGAVYHYLSLDRRRLRADY